VIAKVGQNWTLPENFVGNGPFVLKEWVPQSKIVVVTNPKYWDAKSVKLTKITFLPIDDNNTGYTMYKNGDVDWMTTVPLDQLEDAQLRKDYNNGPFFSTYYYEVNVTKTGVKELQDVRVRKALSEAIDRATLVKRVTKAGQLPAFALNPPLASYAPPKLIKDDVKDAQKLMAEAGFPGGKGFPKITILYNTNDGHKKVAEYVQDQWKKNLGIEVDLKNEEFKTVISDRNEHNFQIARAGWIGDYADPMTFLDIWVKTSGNNDPGYDNPKYDAIIDKAKSLQPGAERTKLLQQAETILLTDLPVIPFYYYVSNNMLDTSKWSGWYNTPLDIHPWKSMAPK
jgi:oligopeptide transport system substrate-binding protein